VGDEAVWVNNALEEGLTPTDAELLCDEPRLRVGDPTLKASSETEMQ